MLTLTFAAVMLAQPEAVAPAPLPLVRGSTIALEMRAGEMREATLTLRSGESAEVAVVQDGIDVVVDLFGPDGTRLDSVDSPNGRQGPEPVSFVARQGGTYRLRVSPIGPGEPRGRIAFNVVALRTVAATRRLLEQRRRAREAAAAWLRRASDALPADGRLDPQADLAAFDALASGATIVGLGEATHGSRQFNDLRLSLVQRLVTRHGYRLIALEDSASRWRDLEAFIAGAGPVPDGASLEWGWIGRRARRALLDWTRQWNVDHPSDRVRIVGVDPQDSRSSRERLGAFLTQAYGPSVTEAWNAQAAELAAADEQTAVFGDSGTSDTLRAFMQEVVARLSGDGPLLRARFGEPAYRQALEGAEDLAAFVDFNTGSGTISHSRDWYMATALVRAMEQAPARSRTVYWAHNSHVSAAATRGGPTGAVLRQSFGCGYRAIATTFGSGAFIAQTASRSDHAIVRTELPVAGEGDTLETMLASIGPGAHLSTWRCEGAGDPPAWLAIDRPLHWIGGVYDPGSPPSLAYRPYRLAAAFDSIAYFPTVDAEDIPADRPVVPPRNRPRSPGD